MITLHPLHQIVWDDERLPLVRIMGQPTIIDVSQVVILWEFKGLLGLIPQEVLWNANQTYNAWGEAQNHSRYAVPAGATYIEWGQTVPVPKEVIRVLQNSE